MSAKAPTAVAYGIESPGFLRTTWAVLVGYLVALLLLFPAWVGLSLLGLVWRSGTTGADPKGLGNWPYLANGLWAGTANVAAACAVLALVARCVASAIERRTGVAVSTAVAFILLVGVGYLAARALPHAAVGLPWLLAAAATALAAGQVPAPYLAWRPRMGRRLAAIAAVSVAVVWIGYPLTHPLRFESSVAFASDQPSEWQTGLVFLHGRPGATRTFSLLVQNPGFTRPVLTGASLEFSGPRALELVDVRAGVLAPFERTTPLRRLAVPSRSDRTLSFVVRLRGCSGVHGTTVVSRIVLRYRTLGGSFSQPLAVRPAPAVHCP